MRVVVVAFDCGSLARLSVAEPLRERSFRESERFAVEGLGIRRADMCWMCVVLVKVRGGSRWRVVNRMKGDGKRCGSRLHPPRYHFVEFRHSNVVVVASWEVAAHVKYDRVLAALRLGKAHSRYLKTFLRSACARVMFAARCSHQCAPKSSKSSAFAKPSRPAHGPPFRWLYSSSSTAKFQSGAVISTKHSRVSLSLETLPREQSMQTPATPYKDKDEREESHIASSHRSILAPQISPMGTLMM